MARLLAVVLPPYFVWEMLQAPAFTGMPRGWLAASAKCALAAAGDGVIVVGIFAVLGLAFRDARWILAAAIRSVCGIRPSGSLDPGGRRVIMVHRLARWGYQPSQPLVPLLDIGVLPFLQPVVLLPLAFWIFARWEARATRDASAPQRVGASTR